MLYSKAFVIAPHGLKGAFKSGIASPSVEAPDENASAIHLWNGSAASVSETATGFD